MRPMARSTDTFWALGEGTGGQVPETVEGVGAHLGVAILGAKLVQRLDHLRQAGVRPIPGTASRASCRREATDPTVASRAWSSADRRAGLRESRCSGSGQSTSSGTRGRSAGSGAPVEAATPRAFSASQKAMVSAAALVPMAWMARMATGVMASSSPTVRTCELARALTARRGSDVHPRGVLASAERSGAPSAGGRLVLRPAPPAGRRASPAPRGSGARERGRGPCGRRRPGPRARCHPSRTEGASPGSGTRPSKAWRPA